MTLEVTMENRELVVSSHSAYGLGEKSRSYVHRFPFSDEVTVKLLKMEVGLGARDGESASLFRRKGIYGVYMSGGLTSTFSVRWAIGD